MGKNKNHRFINSTIFLAGSFTFAFLFGEMVHEFGHYFSHIAYGNSNIGVYLNPFGSSKIIGVTSLPLIQMGVTSAAGPLTNLILGVITSSLLWRFMRPTLFPLLLWGPVAMIQEGVNFSFGLLTPGGDAQWISTLGIPQPILVIVGAILIMASLVLLSILFTTMGFTEKNSRFRFFLMILLGMCSLMLIRFVYTAITNPASVIEDLVPLVFSLILAVIIIMIHPIIVKGLNIKQTSQNLNLTQGGMITAVVLGSGIFLFQILYSVFL